MKRPAHATREEYGERALWLEARRLGIGASDAAVILGQSPWKSPLALYAEKAGLIRLSTTETEAMEWGARMEPFIVAKYEEVTRRPVWRDAPFTIYRHAEFRFMAATFDAFTEQADALGVVEAKNVGFYVADEWAAEPPLMYQIQLQHQLKVAEWGWGSLVAVLGGNRFVRYDIERNDTFIELMLEQEAAFWRRVETQDPPLADGSDATRQALSTLYPEPEAGRVVTLPADAVQWDAQRLDAREQIKKYEAIEKEASNLLRQAIGGAEAGVLPNGVLYTLKAVDKKSYTVPEQHYRELRRKAGK